MSRKSLGKSFFVIDNQFIVHFDREVYRKFYPVIDFESFEILESNGSTFHYFRDKNRVYLDSYMNSFTILPDAEPQDFKILDFKAGMATSRGNDYLFDHKLPLRFSDYRVLSEFYQLAGGIVYFNYVNPMPDVDAKSFHVPQERAGNVALDKYHVYFREKIVEEVDASSFHFLEECFSDAYYLECDHTFYAKDNKHAYYVDTLAKAFKIIKSKNLDQFRFNVMEERGYATDGKHTYLFGKRKAIG